MCERRAGPATMTSRASESKIENGRVFGGIVSCLSLLQQGQRQQARLRGEESWMWSITE